MADNEIDTVLFCCQPSPVFELSGVGAYAAFDAVVDRKNAEVRVRFDEAFSHKRVIVVEAVGDLAGFVGAGPVAGKVVGDDACRGEGDAFAFDVYECWAACRFSIKSNAARCEKALSLKSADVFQGLF